MTYHAQMKTTWTFEHGRLWANCDDGRRIATWTVMPPFDAVIDLLNTNPRLSEVYLEAWLGEIDPRSMRRRFAGKT